MMTLDDAMAKGRGIERPFNCPVHEDSNASASVNVVKGVWCCFACGASGTVDGKRAPSAGDLAAMLGTEVGARRYSASWLELFDPLEWAQCHWGTRFAYYAGRHMGLGQDPFTSDATFPVHDHLGNLAGVGRRRADPGDGPRYVYPKQWSAARAMAGYPGLGNEYVPTEVRDCLVLVEGAGDTTALIEAGINALGCYGAGTHAPQRELIARLNPKFVVLAFDNDEAGDNACFRTINDLGDLALCTMATWETDPAAAPLEQRIEVIHKAVTDARYGDRKILPKSWAATRAHLASIHPEEDHDATQADRPPGRRGNAKPKPGPRPQAGRARQGQHAGGQGRQGRQPRTP